MINELKDLEKLLKLCRKHGVTDIEVQGAKFKLGDIPFDQRQATAEPNKADPYTNFPEGELTPEQLMFYSSGGMPENDPFLKESN